jgi:hypothetical protein
MEIFPAADVEQFEYIKKVIDECDYYVLIIGARYGSVDAAGVSFTFRSAFRPASVIRSVATSILREPATARSPLANFLPSGQDECCKARRK